MEWHWYEFWLTKDGQRVERVERSEFDATSGVKNWVHIGNMVGGKRYFVAARDELGTFAVASKWIEAGKPLEGGNWKYKDDL